VADERGDGEAVTSCFDGVAGNGDTAEVVHDEAAEGVVRPVGQSDASLGLEIAAVQEAVDVGAAAGRGSGGTGARVVLVADLADDLLDEVLDGDDPVGAPVLVDDHDRLPAQCRNSLSAASSGLPPGIAATGRASSPTVRAGLQPSVPAITAWAAVSRSRTSTTPTTSSTVPPSTG
jgi:hypothetical protein